MRYKNTFRIESARLHYWDYSNPGMYFVTICTQNFVEWFGVVNNEKMDLNKMGEIADSCWTKIPNHFPNVELDEYIIMPNHIHGIIGINDISRDADHNESNYEMKSRTNSRRDVACNVSTSNRMSKISPKPNSLSTIIRSFKSAVTKLIRKCHNPNFAWQPRFYDHVIRNENSLEKIQNYILLNPKNWDSDKNNLNEDSKFISKL